MSFPVDFQVFSLVCCSGWLVYSSAACSVLLGAALCAPAVEGVEEAPCLPQAVSMAADSTAAADCTTCFFMMISPLYLFSSMIRFVSQFLYLYYTTKTRFLQSLLKKAAHPEVNGKGICLSLRYHFNLTQPMRVATANLHKCASPQFCLRAMRPEQPYLRFL